MTKLKSILTSYANVELAPLGVRKTRSIRVDKLRQELEQTVRRNNWLFAVCIVLAIILFGVQIWAALTYMTQPNVVKAIAGIFGISAAGLVTQMIKLCQEKLAIELLLGLLPGLGRSPKPSFWEYEAMEATRDYQDNIPLTSAFDLVVCILWKRLGSPLGIKPERPGGGRWRSGYLYL